MVKEGDDIVTKEMKELFNNLNTVKVKNIVSAYDYLGNEINGMDMNGTLDFTMTGSALKNINKEFKVLKKFYKGKIEINPDSLYMKYQEETQEYFFLICLVKLMQYNAL